MKEQFSRTKLLYGEEAMKRLADAKIAVFGIGGVGGYTVEALARSGVGSLTLIDNDKVCFSNLNRQIIATMQTVGKYKVDVMKERILEINPEAKVEICKCFYLPQRRSDFNFGSFDYIVDAIDTVTAKIDLVLAAKEAGVPVISAMGAGNKLHPELFEVADIYETSVCPLAKVMRKELKKRNVDRLKVVYSKEKALTPLEVEKERNQEESEETEYKAQRRRAVPGSTAFTPSVAGLILASEIINDLAFGMEEK